MEIAKDDAGHEEIFQCISGAVVAMVLKCAMELRIADIIHSHGGPISLSQIASAINNTSTSGSSSLNISYLERILRLLVHKNILSAHHVYQDSSSSEGGDLAATATTTATTLYGLTDLSKWILWDSKPNLVAVARVMNHPSMLAPWQYLSQSVIDGERPFKKAHGCDSVWEFTPTNPEIDMLFNDLMSSTVSTNAFLESYKEGLGSIGSLVDVGGRTGELLYEIVKSNPHIKGINFDLPHVIAEAPFYEGITHVGGNMFEDIPSADAIFMKGMLHNWSDEMCVKILKNCRKAISQNTGKLIILDVVLESENNNNTFKYSQIVSDLIMMVVTMGKERTEAEWKRLLKAGGFPRYKINKIPDIQCIIEAYPI